MTQEEDTALIAAQLADLTGTVEAMAKELKAQQQRAETQQERIEIAAQELVEVSERLQVAANALRQSV